MVEVGNKVWQIMLILAFKNPYLDSDGEIKSISKFCHYKLEWPGPPNQ